MVLADFHVPLRTCQPSAHTRQHVLSAHIRSEAEELFSTRAYLGVYFASGIVGNVLSLLMGPDVVSVGASGQSLECLERQ